MRLTPEQEAAYALDYGVSRAGLKPEVQAEYDRLLAERRAARPGQAVPELPRRRDIADRVRRAFAGVLAMLGVIAFAAFAVVMSVNTRYDFRTLRADLAPVHFPSGYRLVTVRRSGTDCARVSCSLTETWTWSGNDVRAVPAACSDAYHAMTTAYPPRKYGSVDTNSPMAAGAVCDYYTLTGGPGFTKSGIEVIVRPGRTQSDGGVVIQLTASFP